MLKQPDYSGLVVLLPILRHVVDAGGTVLLEPNEADHIRALGFHAQAGFWSVPRLPADLVAGNPLLEPLGDNLDSFWKPRGGTTPEAPQVTIPREDSAKTQGTADVGAPSAGAQGGNPPSSTDQAPDRALEKECTSVLAAVERAGGGIPKRLLQKKLWRIRAERFNQLIQSLVEQDLLRVEGNILIASLKTECVTAVTKDGGI